MLSTEFAIIYFLYDFVYVIVLNLKVINLSSNAINITWLTSRTHVDFISSYRIHVYNLDTNEVEYCTKTRVTTHYWINNDNILRPSTAYRYTEIKCASHCNANLLTHLCIYRITVVAISNLDITIENIQNITTLSLSM